MSGSTFVAVRLLLIHLPEREEVLARLVSVLAPGGRILVEEYDLPLRRCRQMPTGRPRRRSRS
jgi:hypothetical protein